MSLPAEALTIRVLTPADVPAALHLSNESGWNQREQDWRAAVGMTPGASFCATADGAVVGTCIGIAYGTFSWIAMMLVDPAFQRRGLGAGLLLRTIDALPPDQPIGLDATAVGRLLYEQHGFHDACSLTRWIADRARLEQVPTRRLQSAPSTPPIFRPSLPSIATCSEATADACSSGHWPSGRTAAPLPRRTDSRQDTFSGGQVASSLTWAQWSHDRNPLRRRWSDTSQRRRTRRSGSTRSMRCPSGPNGWRRAGSYASGRSRA
jgi:GNAT superfamily N-acetyltransferase